MRVGLIGAGIAGTSHLFDLVADDRFEVTGVYSPTASRAEQVAATFRVPHAAKIDPLLDARRVDAVVLATPPAAVPHLLSRAVADGLLVLVEKPGATTADELYAVAAGVRTGATGTPTVAVAYNRRYQRHVQQAHRIVNTCGLGRLTRIECRWRAPFRQRYTAGETYRCNATRGHGVVLDTACHVLDLLLYLGLGPLSVTAARLVTVDGGTGPDIEAHLDLTGRKGVPAAVHVEDGPEEEWQLVVEGERGLLTLDRSRLVQAVEGQTVVMDADDADRPVDDLLRMRSGVTPHGATLAEAARCLAVVDAVRVADSLPRKPWLRPRVKALGRLNGSC